MARILAVDPGNTESGYCITESESFEPLAKGKIPNRELLEKLKRTDLYDEVVIEMVSSYGMPVGATIFETVLWIGRFTQRIEDTAQGEIPVAYLRRGQVKINICRSNKATDATIRCALADRFAHGVKNYGKGTKDSPGWFYGFRADVWQAYALAVTYIDLNMVEKW